MARRVLSANLPCSLLLAFSLASCRHEDRAPAPSASASALGSAFTARTHEQHLQAELTRARARWQAKPNLAGCAAALKEKADLELCQAASHALALLTSEPTATAEVALARLEPTALALTRLSERLRYLSLAELAQRRVQGDAGVAPAPSASAAPAGARNARAQVRKGQSVGHHEQRALELGDGPVSQLMGVVIQLERDVLRNLGAYLEYDQLPVRRAAFDAAKRLRGQHPQWAALDHLLREAAVLESNEELKREQRELAESGLPRSARPVQSAEIK